MVYLPHSRDRGHVNHVRKLHVPSNRTLWTYRASFDEGAVYGVVVTGSMVCFGITLLCGVDAEDAANAGT